MWDETTEDNHQTASWISHGLTWNSELAFFCHKSSILPISTSEVVLFLFKLSYHKIIDRAIYWYLNYKENGDLNQAGRINEHCRNFFWWPRFYRKDCNLDRVDLGRTVRSQDFLLDVRSKGLLNHFSFQLSLSKIRDPPSVHFNSSEP